MKTKRLVISLLVLSYAIFGFSADYSANIEDTIKFKVNGSEFRIYVDEEINAEKLQEQIENLLINIYDVIDNLDLDNIISDTVFDIKIKNEIDTIEEVEEDFNYVEPEYEKDDYVFDYDYSYDDDYSDWDYNNYDYDWDSKPKRKFKRIRHKGIFSLGFNNYLDNGKFPDDGHDQYALNPWGSWNFEIGGLVKWYVARPLSFDLGYSFSRYKFKYQDSSTRIIKDDEGIEFISYEGEGRTFTRSKTKVSYINLSFIPTLDFSEFKSMSSFGLRLGVGVYAGYRIGGKIKQVYNENNSRYAYKNKDGFFLNSYRYGVKAILGFGKSFELYATYDLSPLYAEGRGPELNPISFGVSWIF